MLRILLVIFTGCCAALPLAAQQKTPTPSFWAGARASSGFNGIQLETEGSMRVSKIAAVVTFRGNDDRHELMVGGRFYTSPEAKSTAFLGGAVGRYSSTGHSNNFLALEGGLSPAIYMDFLRPVLLARLERHTTNGTVGFSAGAAIGIDIKIF